jgi:hypothetical protein
MDLLEQLTYDDEGKLFVNDALLTIAVCAAGVDQEYSPQETDRIVALALANKMFRNEIETVERRVFHLVNSIGAGDRQAALERAVKSLPEEMKETAFAWAVDMIMADGVLPHESGELIRELAEKLSVDSGIAAEIIKVMAIRNRTINRGAKVDSIK